MDTLTPAALVHYYDTRTHGIPCGVRGSEHRSTKHARSVTCHTCVGLIGKRPMMDAPPPPDASQPAAP